MKNRTIFLCVALAACFLLVSGTATAQFTQVWKKNAGTWPLMTGGDNTRGAALNSSAGHYLVARRDIPRIYVFDAATGTLLDSLTMTGVAGGTVALVDIEATSDGVIYGTNLVLNTGADTVFQIYRWANDNNATVPTVAYTGKPTKTPAARLGDAFDVAGSGTGTVIFVGGNNAVTKVQKFVTADGATFTYADSVNMTGQDAATGIAQVTPGGDFYASKFASGAPVRLYNNTGTRKEANVTTLFGPQADLAYLDAGGRKWLAAAPESISAKGRATLVNITYGLPGAVKVGSTPLLDTAANTNASGDVELQWNNADSSITMYVLADNNGIAAYKTANLLKINLKPGITNVVRTQFVPLTSANDTVYADVQDDQFIPSGNMKLNYNSDGGAFSSVVMTRTAGDSIKGTYRGIIPGSANTDGKRITYFVRGVDNSGDTTNSATVLAYFAGITKMTLTGPRAVDTATGANLWIGYGIRVSGVCTQEDSLIAVPTSRHDVVLQDDAGGMDFIEFANSSVPPPWRMRRGRLYIATGLIAQFSGHIQVGIPGASVVTHVDVIDQGPAISPAAKLITMHDLSFALQGEQLENSLVRVAHARLTASSTAWPAAGAGGTNITITDNPGVDSLTLRVPALSSANGFPPKQPFTITGVASQFDASSPFKDGYQIIMRQIDDVAGEVKVALKDTSKVNIGSDVVVTATVENINGTGILAYQFNLAFDSTALKFKSVSVAGTISSGFTLSSNLVNGGLLRLAAAGSVALKDSGALFTITLNTLKPASSLITLTGQFNEGSPSAIPAGGVVITSVPKQVVNIATPSFKTAVTNVGHLGALNNYQDTTGFIYGGADKLYEGSFAFATNKSHVSNALRKVLPDAWNAGLRPLEVIQVTKTGATTTMQSVYDDSNQTSPLGIKVIQRTIADTSVGKSGYLMLRFWVVNRTVSPLTGLLVGSYFDFDITPSTGNDRGELVKDSTNQIPGVSSGNPFKIHVMYQRQDPAANYIGLVPLSQTVFAGGRVVMQPTEVYSSASFHLTDSVKYQYLSTWRAGNVYGDGGVATDLGMIASVGPYTVAANDSARAALAVVVGANLGELIANARQAQKDYVAAGGAITVLTDVKQLPNAGIPLTFGLEQNYPNPFNPSTTINFALPKSADVSLKVYDVLGREVWTLVSERLNAGYQQVVWDGRSALGAQVASGMYIYRITAGEFTSTKKMMMLK